MRDLSTSLANLRRPRLLVGAARKGLCLYRRERDLPRILGETPGRTGLGDKLMGLEQKLEQTRARGDVTYSVSRHIAVLTALLAEARLRPDTA
ncbi:DUF6477 family protein [Oceanibium sediminis]|uniref:DUF6477 family protein n=1 Tax=Oceanibium sediminis TaxID=2026339 RepID=UPI000DD3156F|nr:DUF6477 family protein [Oceanibium sediminis]